MSWWKKLFGKGTQSRMTGARTGSQDTSSGLVCEGLAPERLDSVRDVLAKRIASLPLVREGLLGEFWGRGPIDALSGATATTDAVIAKVKEEARLIRQHVANIQSLDVTIELSERFDGVAHDAQKTTSL